MQFVYVPGGCYQMGDVKGLDKDSAYKVLPVHEVCVKDLYVGKFEVTQGQWRKVMNEGLAAKVRRLNPQDRLYGVGDDLPMYYVSWPESQSFVSRFNAMTGVGARLPSEAEWEYAARSRGKLEKYAGGLRVDRYAWFVDNSSGMVHRVGLKEPNSLGLYDMSGNVLEWNSDWYDVSYYKVSPKDSPQGPPNGTDKSRRGGSFDKRVHDLTTFYRGCDPVNMEGKANNGMRLVIPATELAGK